jgi:hypothetical protein
MILNPFERLRVAAGLSQSVVADVLKSTDRLFQNGKQEGRSRGATSCLLWPSCSGVQLTIFSPMKPMIASPLHGGMHNERDFSASRP